MTLTTLMVAEAFYTHYCEQVGGKAYDGKPLPNWLEFVRDPKKQKQSDAWISMARFAIDLLAVPPAKRPYDDLY